MRLFELTEQYNTLLEMAQEDDCEALQAMLVGLEGKIEEKVENTVKVMKSIEYDSEAIDAEVKRLQQRRTVLLKNVERIKCNIAESMKAMGIEQVKGTLHTVAFKKNPPKVKVLDETAIPNRYWKFPKSEPALDKIKLLEDLKSGEYTGSGATMIQEKSLQIK